MAVTSLKDAFPRMSLIEKQARALKALAFGMMPMILDSLSPEKPPFTTDKV